jgi:hypothetical protein
MDNVLNIQLTVSDEQMTTLLKGKLSDLPEEKIQDIFCSALREFFATQTGQQMFYEKRGYYDSMPTPTPLLKEMISNAIDKDLLTEATTEFVETLRDQYPTLIRDAMVNTFSKMFFDNITQATLDHQLAMICGKIDAKVDR